MLKELYFCEFPDSKKKKKKPPYSQIQNGDNFTSPQRFFGRLYETMSVKGLAYCLTHDKCSSLHWILNADPEVGREILAGKHVSDV